MKIPVCKRNILQLFVGFEFLGAKSRVSSPKAAHVWHMENYTRVLDLHTALQIRLRL